MSFSKLKYKCLFTIDYITDENNYNAPILFGFSNNFLFPQFIIAQEYGKGLILWVTHP